MGVWVPGSWGLGSSTPSGQLADEQVTLTCGVHKLFGSCTSGRRMVPTQHPTVCRERGEMRRKFRVLGAGQGS